MDREKAPDTGTEAGLPAVRLRRVTEYIDAHLHQPIRLADISALVYMSRFHFARLFKRSTGLSPHRFVLRRRIDESRVLLATRRLTIADIARSVGFRTPSHFTTAFRQMTGMTPTEYRNSVSEAGHEGARPLCPRA